MDDARTQSDSTHPSPLAGRASQLELFGIVRGSAMPRGLFWTTLEWCCLTACLKWALTVVRVGLVVSSLERAAIS